MAKAPDSLPAREARAALRRRTWTFTLGTEQSASPSPIGSTTAGERFLAVAEVTLDAWAFTGQPIPDYTRANMPGRVCVQRAPLTAEEERRIWDAHLAEINAGALSQIQDDQGGP